MLEMTWRLVTLVTGLTLLAAGSLLLLHAVGVLGPFERAYAGHSFGLDLSAQPVTVVWPYAGSAVALFLSGILLAALAVTRTSDAGRRVVLSGAATNGLYGGGQVTVALSSLRALAEHVAMRVPGVREAAPTLTLGRAGWRVRCRVSLRPDASLPDVSAQLKDALRLCLEHHTGLPVARVDIGAQLEAIDAHRRLR